MAKITKKRGRPAIKPYIERIIGSMVLDEQKKPQEARMPPKVLADKIQKEIKQHIKQGDRLPELSTLEKRISAYAKGEDPRDEPWSIFSLRKYPIPPEALPTVLNLWVWKREIWGYDLTIREAQWVARLSVLAKNIPVRTLLFVSGIYAINERICELTGMSLTSAHSLDLYIFQLMTGQEITPERAEKIVGQEEEEIFMNLTEAEATFLQHINEEAGGLVHLEVFEDIEELLKKKETQNDS